MPMCKLGTVMSESPALTGAKFWQQQPKSVKWQKYVPRDKILLKTVSSSYEQNYFLIKLCAVYSRRD
jgi:hypothetical protein